MNANDNIYTEYKDGVYTIIAFGKEFKAKKPLEAKQIVDQYYYMMSELEKRGNQ